MTSTAISKASALKELKHEESIFEDSLRSMENGGRAIRNIKEKELWKAVSETFDAYCWSRWQFREKRAFQLIKAVGWVDEARAYVEENKIPVPLGKITLREAHVRAIEKNADGIEDQVQLLADAIKAADKGPLTDTIINKTAAKARGEEPAPRHSKSSAPAKPPEPEAPDTTPEATEEPTSDLPGEPEQTMFNPEELEGTVPPKPAGSDGAKRAVIHHQMASLKKKAESMESDMGVLVRNCDDCHAGGLHKQVIAHWSAAMTAMKSYQESMEAMANVWNESARRKCVVSRDQ